MLVRLLNTFITTENKYKTLPRYIVLILDDDLIMFLDYKGAGVAQLLGHWLNWLVEQFSEAIHIWKDKLPVKSKDDNEPCIYWCLTPLHANFNIQRNELRKMYNFTLELLLTGHSDMRVIKIKIWSFNEGHLVKGDKITESGMFAYWRAVDEAFVFNANHHELFLAKKKWSKNANKTLGSATTSEIKELNEKNGKCFFST